MDDLKCISMHELGIVQEEHNIKSGAVILRGRFFKRIHLALKAAARRDRHGIGDLSSRVHGRFKRGRVDVGCFCIFLWCVDVV